MPRLALLGPLSLGLILAAGACAAQYQADYPPAYQPGPYAPQYSTPYPPSYYAPRPRYRDYAPRPYPDYGRRQYPDYGRRYPDDRRWQYSDYSGRPYASYPRQRPADRQPQYRDDSGRPYASYPQQRPDYQQPQDRDETGYAGYPQQRPDYQEAGPAYAEPARPAYSERQAPAGPPAQGEPFPEPGSARPSAPPSQGQLFSPAEEGRRNLVTAAEAPLHDLNLVRQTIPPVLTTAMSDPYAAPSPPTCDQLAFEIENLSQALGPDYDAAPPEKAKGVAESGGLGLSLLHSAAASLIPYHGYVSTLTGAAKHDDLVTRALGAGNARRAYLKGLGEAQRCPSPASPSHADRPPIRLSDESRRPYYPIR